MSDTIQLTPKARKILDGLLATADLETPRAFTDDEMVELALRVFEIAQPLNNTVLSSVFGLAVAQFELDRTNT